MVTQVSSLGTVTLASLSCCPQVKSMCSNQKRLLHLFSFEPTVRLLKTKLKRISAAVPDLRLS